MSDIARFLGPTGIRPFLAIWALAMIAVPIVAARGEKGRAWGISTGVVAQVAAVVAVLAVSWSAGRTLLAVVAVPILGWSAEFVGSRTGIPFGRYHYTERLRPQIHRVPIAIPLAWLMMLPPSWAVAEALFPDSSRLVRALVAGYAFMAWDVYLDPLMVRWRFWEWDQDGSYLGIPLVNFLGWFLCAVGISLVVDPPPLLIEPLVLIYAVTWLLQAGGHFVFWRWPVSGLAGFAAMGLVVIPLILRLARGAGVM